MGTQDAIALSLGAVAAGAAIWAAAAAARGVRAAARAIHAAGLADQRRMLLAAASDLITALDRYDTVAWDLGRQQEKHGPLSADELSVLTPHMDALDSLITRTRLIIGADPIGQWILDWTYTWVVEAYQSEETELHLKAIASEMGEAWQLKTVVEGQESILGQSPDPVRFPTVSTWIEKYRDAALREESGSIFWKGLPHRNQALAALRDFGHTYLVPWLESELAPPAKGAPKQ